MFKNKALVSIDGAPPKLISAGQTTGSVKLISADSNAAVFEVDGKQLSLGMGQSFAAVGGTGGGRPQVVLAADGMGHFMASGAINGNDVKFLVDTGASSVAIPAGLARRMGINYKSGEMIGVSTASGVIPAWRTQLNSVRVGEITLYGIEGLVLETPMNTALLGMSFLNRTDMKREGQIMTLMLRY